MLALVNGMDVVKIPNLMDGKEYKGHKNKCISLEMLLQALLFHYAPELGNCCRLFNLLHYFYVTVYMPLPRSSVQ